MADQNVQHDDPIDVPKTRRAVPIAVLTSMPAGKVVPLAYVPLLRQDQYSGSIDIKVEMQETKEILMNGVVLRVTAYVVPWLAMSRFQGSRDQFDRSWAGQPKDLDVSAPVVPFIETLAYGTHGSNLVYKYMGLHGKSTDLVNTIPLEAYNTIDNFRATNRSRQLSQRTRLQTDLAPAFWHHGRLQHVVPNFNQAVIDGKVALNVVNPNLPVIGIGKQTNVFGHVNVTNLRESTGTRTYANAALIDGGGNNDQKFYVEQDTDGLPKIFAELRSEGMNLSLANLDMAKRTAVFARLRERFEGIDDDWVIDMLMDGLEIPDQHLKQPILIGDATVPFTQAKRYATNSGNLAESASSGAAMLSMNLRVPKMQTGGVIMVLAEAIPQQLFERQRDTFFHIDSVADMPSFLRDHLDPEKVEVVFNRDIDTSHGSPDAHFGYAPLNWKWTNNGPKIGGDFFRPTVDAAIDDLRQRIWAVETANPELAEDFYRVGSAIHLKPFLDDSKDPFQVSVSGGGVIVGNTVFGPLLPEAKDENYDKVAAKAPTELIEQQ